MRINTVLINDTTMKLCSKVIKIFDQISSAFVGITYDEKIVKGLDLIVNPVLWTHYYSIAFCSLHHIFRNIFSKSDLSLTDISCMENIWGGGHSADRAVGRSTTGLGIVLIIKLWEVFILITIMILIILINFEIFCIN